MSASNISSSQIQKLRSFYNEDYFEKGAFGGYKRYGRTLGFKVTAFLWVSMVKLLLRPKSLLDVGCATGQFVRYFRKLGVNAYGIDSSSYAISQVPREVRKYCFLEDVVSLPFEDNAFDVVLSFDFLEHVPEKHVMRALSECNRVSRKYMFHKINTGITDWRHRKPTHVTLRPVSWWLRRLRSIGLDIKCVFFVPMTWIIVTQKDSK